MSSAWKDYQHDLREIFNEKMHEATMLYDGWQKAFVPQMLDEMFDALGSYVEDFEVYQIKEKYGSLTIYWGWNFRDYTDEEDKDRKEIDDEIKSIVEKYRKISEHTCIQCGSKAVLLSTGWVLPFCDECYDRKMGVFGFIED